MSGGSRPTRTASSRSLGAVISAGVGEGGGNGSVEGGENSQRPRRHSVVSELSLSGGGSIGGLGEGSGEGGGAAGGSEVVPPTPSSSGSGGSTRGGSRSNRPSPSPRGRQASPAPGPPPPPPLMTALSRSSSRSSPASSAMPHGLTVQELKELTKVRHLFWG